MTIMNNHRANIDAGATIQRDVEGRLRHLITLDGLKREEITALLDLAQFYVRAPGDLAARDQSLAGLIGGVEGRLFGADEVAAAERKRRDGDHGAQ